MESKLNEEKKRIIHLIVIECGKTRNHCLFGITVDDIEKEMIKKPSYKVALKTTELTLDDMETIYRINKIAMNVSFMINKLNKNNN